MDIVHQLIGDTPPIFILVGIGLVFLLICLATPRIAKQEESPDEKLGRTVRSLYKQLQPPKDKQ